MKGLFVVASLLIGAAGVVAARRRAARVRTDRRAAEQNLTSASRALADPARRVNFAQLDQLPSPVARYFRYALQDGQAMIRVARFAQLGRLRTSPESHWWLSFRAEHTVAAAGTRGFLWRARVGVGATLPLYVDDAYQSGIGRSQVSLLSIIPLSKQVGSPQMQAGALHRYLAEAVWYPTALLPEAGVQWTAIDDRRALATLSDAGVTVSLEFRFADSGAVASVYTPGRWRSTSGGFVLTPWEGRFSGAMQLAGMRLPTSGEVGWYVGVEGQASWRVVWQGRMESVSCELPA